ncbi:death on curing protein [Anaerocolumna jejuensis DSM 15929]|uniref:Death on curing protein n=1 Tax=Anaerocolumna jejuensis DSM 15929 TaxID=1121322 RepID=A0A1M6T7V6_9FIRM|nr:type II toxin-antitoxin system death-on-curing family toxin [Anaerocolumna jejuensis]SHK52919.1 death on curing protein [Anaerocolumna jejuensis DSM 15929]
MTKLSKEQILTLHSMVIKQSAGLDGVRDNGLLDMALHAPFQTFESTELYPSIQNKAARLSFSIISNHPFIDGNKRIGILAMLVFMDVNQLEVNCSNQDIIELGLGAASGKYNTDFIIDWIIAHSGE